jgi:hypothetical protein
MPIKYDLKDLFQAAFDLEPEDSIVIPCKDFREVERVRVALYRELNKLRRISTEIADEIRVSRINKGSNYAVALTRVPGVVTSAFLITGNGKIREVTKGKDKELERIEQLMKDDGYTREEIEAYKANEANSIPQIEKEEKE